MFLTAFFFPSLPVLLAAVMALPVFALTALLSKKATERLAKEQGEPSDIEAGFYWLHMVSKWGAIALLPYLFIVGLVWIAMNDNASRIFNQAFTVIVILGHTGRCCNSATGSSIYPRLFENANHRKECGRRRQRSGKQSRV